MADQAARLPVDRPSRCPHSGAPGQRPVGLCV